MTTIRFQATTDVQKINERIEQSHPYDKVIFERGTYVIDRTVKLLSHRTYLAIQPGSRFQMTPDFQGGAAIQTIPAQEPVRKPLWRHIVSWFRFLLQRSDPQTVLNGIHIYGNMPHAVTDIRLKH